MKGLMRFLLGQTVFVNVVFVLVIVIGIFTLTRTSIDRYPNVNLGEVVVQTFYPGASPEEVEALVTREIEEALEDLDDLEFISSTSSRERSRVRVKFLDDSDYDKGYDDIRLKVLSIMGELPSEVDPPIFTKIDSDVIYPVVSVNLAGDRSNRALALMAEELKSTLRQIEGVKDTVFQGEYTREYHVLLDVEKLSRLGVTFDQAAAAMRAANATIPAGDMDTERGEFALLVDEQFRTREDIARTVVRRDADGSLVRIADLLDDAYMSYRQPTVVSSVNGQDCVTLQVIKSPQGNALSILKQVKRVVAEYQVIFEREGVSVVLTQDSTIKIKDAMYTLGFNLLLGVLLVSLLIWYFMGFRNAALTSIGIPFAFLCTMIFMYLSDYSLNEITLFSFVLISGIVVDDAIVVIENIYRHLWEGKPLNQAIVDGTSEVFLPVLSATLTTVAAFMPMLIMTGAVGDFFALIPKAVSLALLGSVLECLFILPIHYKDFGPRPDQGNRKEKDVWLMRVLRGPVERLMLLTLRFRFTSLALLCSAFLVSVIIAYLSISGKVPLIKVEFFPDDYGRYYVELEAPIGTSIEKTSAILKEISREIIADGPGMAESCAAYAGFVIDEDYEINFNNFVGHVIVTLPSQNQRRFADHPHNDPQTHLDRIRQKLQPYVSRGNQIRIRPQQDGPPTGKDINVRAVGTNEASVEGLAEAMKKLLAEDERFADQLVDLQDNRGQLNHLIKFKVRHDRAAEHNVQPSQVTGLLAATLNGRYVGEFRAVDEQVDLKLMLADIDDPRQVLTVPLLEHASGPVVLGDLATMTTAREPGYLNRFQTQRAINITANLQPGSDLSSVAVVALVREHYRLIHDRFPGATLNFAGENEDTRRSFSSLFSAFLIALLVIYLILASQFQSYLHPLIVISAVIFAFIGVIFGLFVTRSILTINNLIAMVGVVGVVVNDSLVLIDFINKMYRGGMERRAAVIKGMAIRLRPILLTTMTTTLAFLPMALGIPEYSLVWGSMASTFVTGLCTATFLTLFIVPVLWDISTEMHERVSRRSTGKGED